MKLQVLSDVHLDINVQAPYQIKDKNTFTIVCGDISGSVDTTCKWIDANIKEGLFVAGNHMFYDEPNMTIQQISDKYAQKYPLNAPVSFLNNNTKIINDIVFIGCTLWTDYKLFGSADLYKYYAVHGMNDFRFGQITKDGKSFHLSPEYCEKECEKSIEYIDIIAKKYSDKTVAVITHHAPSIQSIDKEYLNSELSPAFACNLENFILDHPNIMLWCHGHIHSFKDYNIGQCRIVCNPLGYLQQGEKSGFKPEFVVDVSTDSE